MYEVWVPAEIESSRPGFPLSPGQMAFSMMGMRMPSNSGPTERSWWHSIARKADFDSTEKVFGAL
jgi:hypothetical protein